MQSTSQLLGLDCVTARLYLGFRPCLYNHALGFDSSRTLGLCLPCTVSTYAKGFINVLGLDYRTSGPLLLWMKLL